MTTEEALDFFEKHGSFCRCGDGRTFALEAFKSNVEPLRELVTLWGGAVYKPPPAAPYRYTWRLYGAKAISLWLTVIRESMPPTKVTRGDTKLSHCLKKFGEL
jgi:hypothetical protein